MKLALKVIALPLGLAIAIVAVLVIAASFALHAAFGYDEPTIDAD